MAKSLILCNTTIVNSRSFLQSPSYHSIDSTAENLTLNQYDTNKGSHIVGSKLNQNLTIPNHPSNFRYGLSLHEFDSLSSPVGPENLLKGNRKHALIKASHCTVPNSSSHILSEVQLVINQNSESANRSAGSSESKCSGLGESVHDEGRKSGAAVTPSDLVTLINNQESLLLLDCRTFMAFNANHVNGALNVSCSDRITKKRLGDGKVKVLDLVSGQEEKEMYRRLEADAEIVLYDESTREIESLPETSSLRLLSKCLLKHGKHPKFLQGGLQAFQECYSFMCSHPDSTAGVPLLYSPTSPEINCQIDTAVASEILPYLFIGNQRDAENKERLIELGVTHILNVTSHLPLHFEMMGLPINGYRQPTAEAKISNSTLQKPLVLLNALASQTARFWFTVKLASLGPQPLSQPTLLLHHTNL